MGAAAGAKTREAGHETTSADRSQALQEQSRFDAPHSGILALQRTTGNRAVSQILQTKLTVNRAGDIYEQEADRVAAAVLQMSDFSHAQAGIGINYVNGVRAQRLCTECAEGEQERETIQRKELPGQMPELSASIEPGIDELRNGGGRPLPHNVRAFFEPRFGRDFSHVIVHTEPKAASMARALHARAFTVGQDVFLPASEFVPETPNGQKLLAHELTHVVQQTGGNQDGPAHTNGNFSVSGNTPNVSSFNGVSAPGSHGVTAQRKEEELGALDYAQAVLDPKSLIGIIWLRLSQSMKLKLIDKAIDAAVFLVDEFPGRFVVGGIWEFIKEGLKGFYGKLKSAAEDVKIRAMDKLAMIIAGRDEAFTWAYLKGILKGFFIDGALGIFIAIWDLIKGLGKLWDFLKGIGEAIGRFPEEMEQLLQGFVNVEQELAANIGPAIDEVKKLVTDRQQAASFISTIVEKGKNLAKEAGEKIADSLLGFFSKPEASAEIGETVGNITGQALWEVVFAVVTAGGGAAITAVKAGIKSATGVLGKLVGKIVTGVLKLVEEIRLIFGKVVEWVKGAVKFVKGKLSEVGGRFAKLLEDVGEFFAKLLRNCHESTLVCNLPGKSRGKVAKVAPDIEAAVEKGIVEEATVTTRPSKRARPARPKTTGRGAAARGNFEKVRDGYAKRLGVGSGGQVHHGIELQTLDRYPGVFTEKELNAFENMRGIATEQANKRQLHNSKVREMWDRHYRRIDEEIAAKKLKPGTQAYNNFVKRNLIDARDELDYVLGQFFSEYRTGRPRSFK